MWNYFYCKKKLKPHKFFIGNQSQNYGIWDWDPIWITQRSERVASIHIQLQLLSERDWYNAFTRQNEVKFYESELDNSAVSSDVSK